MRGVVGGVEASGAGNARRCGTADACECYFPAFQFVVWAGKPRARGLDAAMFETHGQA